MRRSILVFTALASTAFGPATAFGQSSFAGRAGERVLLPPAEEIALARSAAPAAVSDEATILLFDGQRWTPGVEGSNGVTCYVARTWPEALEPHCFDREGSETILRIHVRQNELFVAGHTSEEAERILADEILKGDLRLPDRPVMSYMMSSAQVLYSESGDHVGSWRPHLMIYYPYLTQEDVGGDGGLDGASVSDPGSPLANIVVVVPTAVAPRSHETGGR